MLNDLQNFQLYDIFEAAELVGMSVMTLRRAIKRGELKASQVGRQWRIPKSEIERIAGFEKTISVEEAAKILKIKRETLRVIILEGKLKAVRFAPKGAWRIKISDLKKFIGIE